MRASVLATIEALIAFAFTATIPVEKRGPGYLKFPVSANSQSSTNLTNKRRAFEADTYYNWDTYTLFATVGTPGDQLVFELQTANWFSWVNPMCQYAYDVEECQDAGFYDYDSSRTSGQAGGTFYFYFNEDTSTESVVEGNWVYDTWTVEGTPISGTEFGMVYESSGASMHAFGLGCSYLCGGTLPSALDWIYMTDLIESQAFSLDLGSVDPGDGSIIFGGIDIMKYSGALQKVPWVPMSKRVWEGGSDFDPKYYVGLIVVGVTFPPSSGKSNKMSYLGNLPYYLDNAAPTNLDIGTYNTIAGWFADQKEGSYFDCSIMNEKGTIDFYFGTDAGITAVIHVPFSEWFTHLESGLCSFDASPATNGPSGSFSLGPSFMRSAFLVFDQVNRNVLMGQAVYCGEEIVPIGSGPDAVPSMTGLCDPPFTGIDFSISSHAC